MHFKSNWRPGGRTRALVWFVVSSCLFPNLYAVDLDVIGVTLLQSTTTNLDGSGIRAGQAEADIDTNQPPTFEVDPAAAGVSANLITYKSSLGSSTNYPNLVGGPSWHASQVGGIFYGLSGGIATNLASVDNFEANYFINSVVGGLLAVNDPVVNQSFIDYPVTVPQQQMLDSAYDNYAAKFHTLFVSGAGNAGGVPVSPPSTCYNGISVGAYIDAVNYSSVGPTLDNGRAKPDITAPSNATSFSTPQVSGAAALLLQAGLRGDGGIDTNSASDIRTLKALLLNGAIKPVDWTNGPASPLDARYGAGVLNVFNSYEQLAGGKHGYIVSMSVSTNSPHPPTGAAGTLTALSGWDFNTSSSAAKTNGVNHYYFNVTNASSQALFTASATLVWNRQQNQTDINHLDLFLYDAATSNLIASSASSVDNVEHLFVPQLPQGRYDLQVLKHGGATVTYQETYALAFEFFSVSLNIAPSGTNATITWPIYPAGFVLESATDLASPAVWSTNNPSPLVTNGQNTVTLDASGGSQFFRLSRP